MQKKPDTKDNALYDSVHMKYQNRQKQWIVTESRYVGIWLIMGVQRDMRKLFGEMNILYDFCDGHTQKVYTFATMTELHP